MTGYHSATKEIKRFYDGFEITSTTKQTHDDIEENDDAPTTLQQLLSISYYYAPTFFDTMKLQKLDNLRRQEWPEEQVHEKVLQQERSWSSA
eukprot:941115-Amphidinium_carterae.2